MKRVLLIGGRGFIGFHLSVRLQQLGHSVQVAGAGDDFVAMLRDNDAVIHLACETTPGSSANAPTREIGNLVTGLQLAEALIALPNITLVNVSSGGTVYGNARTEAVLESAPLLPMSFHGAGKASLELFFGVLKRDGRRVINVRPANVYGPGQVQKMGFGFIRTLLEQFRRNEEMVIWGDGEIVRDFVYVTDVADAIAGLLESDMAGTYNIGSGRGYSLNQLISIASCVIGRRLPVRHLPPRSVDIARNVLDVAAIKAATGWVPSIGLEEGLRITWEVLN